jgi:hypothetical protein
MNVIKLKKSLIGFLKTRLRKEPLIRAGIVSVFSVSTACGVVWLNRYNYFAGTLYRTQTVDFNILSNLLPPRLSTYLSKVPLSIDDINGLQQTLDSNYGLFGIVVTDCKSIENQCPNQNIIYASKSKVEHISSGRQRLITQNRSAQKWTKKFENKDLSDQLLISSPFVILRDPPPLYQEWGFETPSNDKKILYNKQNKGRVIGRAYLIRADAPSINNELKSLKLVYTSVAISALLTGLLILLSIEFSYYLIKEAENKEAMAVKAQIKAEEIARLAQEASNIAVNEKEKADKIARLAQETSKIAIKKQKEAEEIARLAQETSELAIEKQKEAGDADPLAQEASKLAIEKQKEAEESARLAQETSELAIEKQKEAEESARLAQETSELAIEKQKEAEESARLAQEKRVDSETANKTLWDEIEKEINDRTKKITSENNELKKEIKELKNQPLKCETIQPMINERDLISECISIESSEKDFYDGERKDIIIDALNIYMGNVHEDSRREHIVKDIVDLNSPHGEAKTIKKKILKILIEGQANSNNKLENLGFKFVSQNNHLKFYWQGDPRYPIILSTTPSDIKGARNAISTISNKIL